MRNYNSPREVGILSSKKKMSTEIVRKIKALNNFNLELWNNLKEYLSGEKKSFGVRKFLVKKHSVVLKGTTEVKIESMNYLFEKMNNFFNYQFKETEYEDLTPLIEKYDCLIPEKTMPVFDSLKELLEGIQRHLGKAYQCIIEDTENFKKIKEWLEIPNNENCISFKPKKEKEFFGLDMEISLEKGNDYLPKIENTIQFLLSFCEIESQKEISSFHDSFLSTQEIVLLEKWIEEEKIVLKDTELFYRASENGFAASHFHKQCDGKGANVCLIKTIDGHIFGGYTKIGWNSRQNYVNDSDAFLFSIVNPSNNPFKSKNKNSGNAIYDYSSYGPTFGDNHDLFISSNSNQNTSSYSNCGYSYDFPDQYYLCGKYNFQVSEIEVWGIKV